MMVDPVLATWVTNTIASHLRPRYVVGLGLWSAICKDPVVQRALSAMGDFNYLKPTPVTPFRAYKKKKFLFHEWDFVRPDDSVQTFVSWPQHPGRASFTNTELWEDSVTEFCTRVTG